jgi:hypothetical protein
MGLRSAVSYYDKVRLRDNSRIALAVKSFNFFFIFQHSSNFEHKNWQELSCAYKYIKFIVRNENLQQSFHRFLNIKFLAKISRLDAPTKIFPSNRKKYLTLVIYLVQFPIHRCSPFEYRSKNKRDFTVSKKCRARWFIQKLQPFLEFESLAGFSASGGFGGSFWGISPPKYNF